jgi:hypothetical protein
MQNDDLIIYAVRMADSKMRYQSSFKTVEVIANAHALSPEERAALASRGCLFDDECQDNISTLNPWWGELTAIHYLLQTNTESFIGNAQHRRFWHDRDLAMAPKDGLCLSVPCRFNCSLAQQFCGGHRFDGVGMTMSVANAGKLPFTAEEMAAIWNQPYFQGGPMAVGNWEHYKTLMTLLFSCLWPIWEIYEEDIRLIQGYDQRAMAFLSERLLTGIIMFKDKFIPRIPLYNIQQGFIGP